MSGENQVEVKTSPPFVKKIVLKQNGFSNGKVITFVDELTLELKDGWYEEAKKEIGRVYNLNLELQRDIDKKKEEEVKKQNEPNNRAARSA